MLSVNLKVGSYQDSSIRGDVRAVCDVVKRTLEQAATLELDIVVFPELFLQGYDTGVEALRLLAVKIDSDEIAELRAMAFRYELAIAIGYAERDDDIIYNSCCLIDAGGSVVLNYRKTHLWDPDSIYEKAVFSPGNELPIADIYIPRRNHTVTVGILICFDCEFPEPARIMALKGASIILIPTAIVDNMTPVTIVPTRATENHVFVLYSNLSGPCIANPTVECNFCGQSAIIAPDGVDLARSAVEGGGLLHATINGAQYAAHVHRNNYLVERRADLYGTAFNA